LFASRAVKQRSVALPKQAAGQPAADRVAADGPGCLSPDRRRVRCSGVERGREATFGDRRCPSWRVVEGSEPRRSNRVLDAALDGQ
jgi:hypothetical protein